jgi:ubiquinone biosynthesis protein UbiJ
LSKLANTIATLFESSINRYLALDPSTQESVAALENKSITLVLKEFSFPLYFKIENKRIKVLSEIEVETDVRLATSVPALLQMTLSDRSDESVLGSEIDMSGNMDVGREFRNIFKNVDIDGEEILSRYTGDIIAHKLGNGYRQFSHWLGGARQTIESDISEFLQEESRQLPSSLEVAGFINEVDDVRLAVDRAEARFEMLRKTMVQLPVPSSEENK